MYSVTKEADTFQQQVMIVPRGCVQGTVHAGGHSAPLLKEMLSEVALEIEFPSIRQICGEGGFRSRVRKYETALSKTQNHDPAWRVQVPVSRIVWNSWKVEQLEIMSENKGRAISPKASYSK